ncbi:thioredoxin family protein [Azospirillum griseum]|uniref:Thioredoxin n=1 Tax=Azospirillum griseum TaxID=2496639 RepID=A0A431VA17_9PROT|nr:thioredoxin family protein [Azospirillum griseum]RTR13100.1 thioredoxin [Azospirillum griseum]
MRVLPSVSGLIAAAAILLPLAVQAGQPFDAAAFQQAQAAAKTILVDVSAPWCPTCQAQKPTVQALEQSQPSLVVFDVDFDTAKDVLRRFKVQYQSTLIVFKGATEVGRSTGETRPDAIRALVAKGL